MTKARRRNWTLRERMRRIKTPKVAKFRDAYYKLQSFFHARSLRFWTPKVGRMLFKNPGVRQVRIIWNPILRMGHGFFDMTTEYKKGRRVQ